MLNEKMTLSEIESFLKDGRSYITSMDYFKILNHEEQTVKIVYWEFDGTIRSETTELIISEEETNESISAVVRSINDLVVINIRKLFDIYVPSYQSLSTLNIDYERSIIEENIDNKIDWDLINREFIEYRFLHLRKEKLITRKKFGGTIDDYCISIESPLPRATKDKLLENSTTFIDEIITEELDEVLQEYLSGKAYYKELIARKATSTHIIYVYRVNVVLI